MGGGAAVVELFDVCRDGIRTIILKPGIRVSCCLCDGIAGDKNSGGHYGEDGMAPRSLRAMAPARVLVDYRW